ncbi:sensor histidine kinase [Rheinheimera nanhaiensis]|uniref:Two-component system, LytT family, sensor kinase n=1 Tax=Rheinheimera nanhaiensis E407-8 TaxID=562729 RepID=I1DYM1_9GAMM|nr:histidine kinase [Rheinheimera nanhaiensis]GAB59149.1 two-component system, LytT family, sensor kinase [Rheinheimera nanhaiensis E407-8]
MYKSLEDRSRQFWILHSLGWFGFAIVNYLNSLVLETRDAYLIVVALDSYLGWLITIPLRYTYQRIWHWSPWKLALTVLLMAFVLAAIWTAVRNFNYWEIYRHGARPDDWLKYIRDTPFAFYVMLSWSGLYFGIKYYQTLQLEKQKSLTATNKAHEAQLKMLRYQLNPHFLFNTLNAISTLVLINEADTANKMVTRLSDFLRYSLYKDPINKVPLEQEVYAARLYLEIEKVRFSERLSVAFDLEPGTEKALVPSLILQPLIENAIKYAVASQVDGGEIAITAKRFGHDLLLEVADNGPGMSISDGLPKSSDSGVGLVNTKERLSALYDNNFALVLTHNQPRGLKVNIRIPLQLEKTEQEHA